MKFSRILVLYLAAMAAPSALAVPLQHSNHCSRSSVGVRCTGHGGDLSRMPDRPSSGGNGMGKLTPRHTSLRLTPDLALPNRQLSTKEIFCKLSRMFYWDYPSLVHS